MVSPDFFADEDTPMAFKALKVLSLLCAVICDFFGKCFMTMALSSANFRSSIIDNCEMYSYRYTDVKLDICKGS